MPLPLPKPIEVFISSENTHDTDALAECFASDATVKDEGQRLKGLKAIKAWRLETANEYQRTLVTGGTKGVGAAVVVSLREAGASVGPKEALAPCWQCSCQ